MSELTNVPELIDIQAKNTEINKSLSPIVAKNPVMQRVAEGLKRLHQLLEDRI